MSGLKDNLLEDLKLEIRARLASDPLVSQVPVHAVGKTADTLQDAIAKSLGTAALSPHPNQAGKRGACVAIHSVDLKTANGEHEGPEMKLRIEIECVENQEVNESEAGIGITAAELVARVTALLHMHCSNGLAAGPIYLAPEGAKELEFYKEHGWMLIFEVVSYGAEFEETAPVMISTEGNEVTMACADPSAVIRYTLDNSPPYSANGDALIYSDPFTPAGDPDDVIRIRAAAEVPDELPSDVQLHRLILS